MTALRPEDVRPPVTWVLLGLLSGVGPGLMLGGAASLAGEWLGPALGVEMGPAAFGVVAAAVILVGAILAVAARGGRHGGLTTRSAPAAGACALVGLVSALLLPGTLIAILAIGLGVLVRIVVAFAAGVAAEATRRRRG